VASQSSRLKVGRLKAFRLRYIGADVTPPTAPTTLVATLAAAPSNDVVLTWAPASDHYGISHYGVERCSGAGCTAFLLIGATPATTYTDTTTTASSTYRYRVFAVDPSGHVSPFSNIATITTRDASDILVWIGGIWQSLGADALVGGAGITQALNEVTDTATVRIRGRVPVALKGTQIRIDVLGERLFQGHITAVRTVLEGRRAHPDNVVYECDALDYTWEFSTRKVTARYRATPAATILADLMQFAPAGYTLALVGIAAGGGPVLEEMTFTNEEISQAVSRVCERAGWYWYVSFDRVVTVFTSAAVPSAGTIDQTHPRATQTLAKHEDSAAIVTQVRARGGGAAAAADVLAGSTSLPVEDASWYAATGGTVEVGPQHVTYGGVSDPGTGALVGTGNAPSGPPAVAAALGSNLAAGLRYDYAVSFVTASGETLAGPIKSYIPAGGSEPPPRAPTAAEIFDAGYSGGRMVPGGSYRWAFEKLLTGGGGITIPGPASAVEIVNANTWKVRVASDLFTANVYAINIFRTTNGGGTFYAERSATSPGDYFTGDMTDGDLAGGPVMGAGAGATYLAAALSQIPISKVSGVTARKLYRTTANGTQLKLLATLPNNTATTYIDTTVDGALGANAPATDTSGILGGGQINAGAAAVLVSSAAPFPASGGWVRVAGMVLRYTSISSSSLVLAAPLPSTLSYGTEILNAPTLTGIPASGTGAIRYDVGRGDEVYVYVVRDDLAARAALAAATGGDGIRAEFLTDGRLGIPELTARADALLAMRTPPLVTVTLATRDLGVSVGKTLTFNTTLPAIVGTFLIQRVTISEFPPRGVHGAYAPLRVVECSSRRYTFEDLVQQIKLLGRIN
jgi:hypothetical protein